MKIIINVISLSSDELLDISTEINEQYIEFSAANTKLNNKPANNNKNNNNNRNNNRNNNNNRVKSSWKVSTSVSTYSFDDIDVNNINNNNNNINNKINDNNHPNENILSTSTPGISHPWSTNDPLFSNIPTTPELKRLFKMTEDLPNLYQWIHVYLLLYFDFLIYFILFYY